MKFREGLLCAVIFTLVALPEVIVLAINAVHYGKSIEMPFSPCNFSRIVSEVQTYCF